MPAVTDLSRREIVPVPKSGKKSDPAPRDKPARFNRTKTAKVEEITIPEPIAHVAPTPEPLPPSQLSLDEMAATGPIHVQCPECSNQQPANCVTCQGAGWIEAAKTVELEEEAA